jgi:integrase
MPKGERGTAKPYLRGKIWWIKYYVNGKPEYESSKSERKADALRLLNQRRSDLDAGKIITGETSVLQLIDLVIADYRLHKKANRKKIEGYKKNYFGPLLGKLAAKDLDTATIWKFIESLRKKKLADATINRMRSALLRGYKLGMENKPPLVASVPKFPRLEEDNVREGFLEHPEYLALRNELPFHQQVLLVIGYHWGMRSGEILKLRWDQVDWSGNILWLSRRQAKNKKARKAPIYGELRKWLQRAYAQRDSEFIVSWRGHSISETKTAWKNAAERAGLKGQLVHDLRRTAIRNMVRAGIPEKLAMEISGHKTRNVFERYNISDERDLHEAGAKMTSYLRKQPRKSKVVTLEVTEKTGKSAVAPVTSRKQAS